MKKTRKSGETAEVPKENAKGGEPEQTTPRSRQAEPAIHPKAPLRRTNSHEDEWLLLPQFGVRVMERLFATIDADPRFSAGTYNDLYSIYLDVLADELRPYASQLAMHLFSHDPASLAILRRIVEEAEEAMQHEDDGT